MADQVVDDLIRAILREVAVDTGGRPTVVGDELPELANFDEGRRLLRRLAVNGDIPARLAPSVKSIVDRASGRNGETEAFRPTYDERPAIQAAVRYVVAASAYSMAAQERVPAPGSPEGRDSLEWHIAKDYAELATMPRILPEVLVNGGRDDLGIIPLPDETGAAVGARALVLGVSARTGMDEDTVLKRFVRAGRGGVAVAAARMLLDTNRTFARLMGPRQQDVIVHIVAAELERGFATDRPLPTIENAIAYTIVERAQAAEWGASAVNLASRRATAEVEKLRGILEAKQAAGLNPGAADPAPVPPSPPAEPPRSVDELMRRIQAAVRDLTDTPDSLWNEEIEEAGPGDPPGRVGASADGALLLDRDQAGLPLFDLTETGSVDPAQLRAVQESIQQAAATFAAWAVPEGHTLETEAEAQREAPEHDLGNQAAHRRFAADNYDEILRRVLPPGLADQLQAVDAPYQEPELAPALQRFALVVDNVKGMATDPSETVRRMAGQDHRGAGTAAAEALVAESGIPEEYRAAAVRMIGETIVTGFDELPDRLYDEWDRTLTPAEVTEKSRRLGRELGQLADAMVRVYLEDPEFARQDRAATERTAAAAIGLPDRRLYPPATAVDSTAVHLEQPAERAAGPRELMERIQGAVGVLTGQPESLWNGELAERPRDGAFAPSAEGTLRLDRIGDPSVMLLTAQADTRLVEQLRDSSGPLTPDELRKSRNRIFDAARAYTQWSVPAGHTREDEAQAERDPRYDAIAESVRDGFVGAELDVIVDGVLPPHLAEQVKAVGPPAHGSASAPAARGLAQSLDEVTERLTNPSTTLRELAGQPRADISLKAAELMVEKSDIPAEDQPAAVQAAAERIDRAFELLPAQIARWQEAGTSNEDLAEKVHEYGYAAGMDAYNLVCDREDNMFTIAAEASGAQTDPSVRFVPGRDQASAAQSGSVQVRGGVQAANPGTAPGQSTSRGHEGRT